MNISLEAAPSVFSVFYRSSGCHSCLWRSGCNGPWRGSFWERPEETKGRPLEIFLFTSLLRHCQFFLLSQAFSRNLTQTSCKLRKLLSRLCRMFRKQIRAL